MHPEWSFSTNIYEVNTRQYTPEGTFKAFGKHLPRLRDMGIETLWFMPITPISMKDRKGSLGSYYAVSDYEKINPEFGTLEDFTELVKNAHSQGFKVIIDWVANHSGNDNIWIDQYPDFYCLDESGQIIHPNGWEDVSKLDHENPLMQEAMITAMAFWIKACDIDGFRCDMAHLVPLDFWRQAKVKLNMVKEGLFWLAECEEPGYHEVFDATYTWKWMHVTEQFYKQQLPLPTLVNTLHEYDATFPSSAFRTYFTSNHDENSWNGTEYEKYGNAAKAFAVFSCTWNGLPMLYSGQELPSHKRLKFFDKDVILWSDCALHHFYKTLLTLHKSNPALWAAEPATSTFIIANSRPDSILIFRRINGLDEIVVVLNLSHEQVILEAPLQGRFRDICSLNDVNLGPDITLEGWGYLVLQPLL